MKSLINIPFALILLFLWACNAEEEKSEIPTDILSKDQMVDIMSELQLIQASKTMRYIAGEEAEQQKMQYFQEVYAKFETSDSLYVASLAYYTDHPTEMNQIYDEVLQKLKTLEEDYR